MAFHGDLSSFPLPDLLQWLDSSRKSGTLQLVWEAGERKLFLADGQVAATSCPSLWERIARMLELGRIAPGQEVLTAFGQMRLLNDALVPFEARGIRPQHVMEMAREDLHGALTDITSGVAGAFHWTEDSDRSADEWVEVGAGLRHLLFEALRWIDEQPDVDRALPLDTMVVRAKVDPTEDLPLLHRVILTVSGGGVSLGMLRLSLGMSRAALTRRIFDMLRFKRIEVDGAPVIEADPIAEMLEKGAVLVREQQFEAAGLIFTALLESDPSDRRVREFARMVEREQVAALYRELPPIFIPRLIEDPDALSLLRPDERHIATLLNGAWDVSTIVLASQHREIDTLKCLSKLNRMGLLAGQ